MDVNVASTLSIDSGLCVKAVTITMNSPGILF